MTKDCPTKMDRKKGREGQEVTKKAETIHVHVASPTSAILLSTPISKLNTMEKLNITGQYLQKKKPKMMSKNSNTNLMKIKRQKISKIWKISRSILINSFLSLIRTGKEKRKSAI